MAEELSIEAMDLRLKLSDMVVDQLLTEAEFQAATTTRSVKALYKMGRRRSEARRDEKARRRVALAHGGAPYTAVRLCFTGFRPPAGELARLQAMGFLVQDTYDAQVHLVVAAENGAETTKAQRARTNHVPVVPAPEFWEAVQDAREFIVGDGFRPPGLSIEPQVPAKMEP